MILLKYASGGKIDVKRLRDEIRNDSSLYKDGSYTNKGRRQLAAIEEIDQNQSKGLLYRFNSKSEFDITDSDGNIVSAQSGTGVKSTDKVNILYGSLNKKKRDQKEISKLLFKVKEDQIYFSPKPEEIKKEKGSKGATIKKEKGIKEKGIKRIIASEVPTEEKGNKGEKISNKNLPPENNEVKKENSLTAPIDPIVINKGNLPLPEIKTPPGFTPSGLKGESKEKPKEVGEGDENENKDKEPDYKSGFTDNFDLGEIDVDDSIKKIFSGHIKQEFDLFSLNPEKFAERVLELRPKNDPHTEVAEESGLHTVEGVIQEIPRLDILEKSIAEGDANESELAAYNKGLSDIKRSISLAMSIIKERRAKGYTRLEEDLSTFNIKDTSKQKLLDEYKRRVNIIDKKYDLVMSPKNKLSHRELALFYSELANTSLPDSLKPIPKK